MEKNLNELCGQPNTNKRIYKTETDTNTESKLMVTKRGKWGWDTLGYGDQPVHTTVYKIEN